ncbi:MAG: hypothetical protein LBI59_03995 [Candidatus Accumulibacter sp.]|jgi:hypothetical protein|nr:hypothetical protein [Accumulibacter sp.]
MGGTSLRRRVFDASLSGGYARPAPLWLALRTKTLEQLLGLRDAAIHEAVQCAYRLKFVTNQNNYSGCNSLIKKDDYDIPALGMDSIVDFFSFAGKRVFCLPST